MSFDIQYNQPLKNYLSWKAGGVAKRFYTPKNIAELQAFLHKNQQPLLFLGLGSNLLVTESGFDGVVVYSKNLNKLTFANGIISAQTGVTLAKIARLAIKYERYGGEFFSTIPGTLGGALAMNAGCFNFETWQWVKAVETIDNEGEIHRRSKQDFHIYYRKVIAKNDGEYFISAELEFVKNPVSPTIKSLLSQRKYSQPIGTSNCGSVFKNPPNNYAAKLIEQADLKGYCIGNACVSTKHANFIINLGDATPSDIQSLITHIQKTVKQRFNIDLETEVKII